VVSAATHALAVGAEHPGGDQRGDEGDHQARAAGREDPGCVAAHRGHRRTARRRRLGAGLAVHRAPLLDERAATPPPLALEVHVRAEEAQRQQ